MALIPWKPLFDFDKFFEDENWYLPIIPRTKISEPAMDLYETEKEIVAELNLPGIDPEKIEISVKNQILNVRGNMEEKEEEKRKGYFRREIRRGSFERVVSLPKAVEENRTEAVYEKGTLKIVMPKVKTKIAEKKIEIKVKKK